MAYRPDTLERVGLVEGLRFTLFPPPSWGSVGLLYPARSRFGPVYSVPKTVLLVISFSLASISMLLLLVLNLAWALVMIPLAPLREVHASNLMLLALLFDVVRWLVCSPAKAANLLLFFWDWLVGPKHDLPRM